MATSELRKQILEALDVCGAEGATRDEIMGLIKKSDKSGVGTSLGHMVGKNIIIKKGDRFYLPDANGKAPLAPRPFTPSHPIPQSTTLHAAENGQKVKLASYQEGRDSVRVTIYNAPDEHEGVVALHLFVGGHWFKLPITGNVRVCVGNPIPKWAKTQEVNYGISIVRVVMADGKTFDRNIESNQPVTISGE
jgi:hypothetical protein